ATSAPSFRPAPPASKEEASSREDHDDDIGPPGPFRGVCRRVEPQRVWIQRLGDRRHLGADGDPGGSLFYRRHLLRVMVRAAAQPGRRAKGRRGKWLVTGSPRGWGLTSNKLA